MLERHCLSSHSILPQPPAINPKTFAKQVCSLILLPHHPQLPPIPPQKPFNHLPIKDSMKYIFILGRNIDLSIEEIKSYCEKEGNSVSIKKTIKNAILVETEAPLSQDTVKRLGGTIGIAEILEFGTREDLLKNIENHELYFGTSNKLNYCIWDFTHSENIDEIFEYIKARFKKEKLKATLKRFPASITLQDETKVPNISSNLIEEEYLIFQEDEEFYFARITQKCNYEEIEARDMNKPVRRESLSISPRLSKILINLSGVRQGEALVDPFCGVGVILSEALLQGIKAVGIDRDAGAIKGAKENLAWFKFKPGTYILENDDSTKVRIHKVEAIATEPDLGKILKKNANRTCSKRHTKRIRQINDRRNK